MEKTGESRLLQMQARFQQKRLQEREMKIASLYEAQQARALDRVRHSPSNIGTTAASPPQNPPSVAHQPGKVRQMFEERRTKAGIDKSYPLQPIHNTNKPAVRKPLPNGYTKVTAGANLNVERKTSKTHTSVTSHHVKRQHKIENIVNGSGDLNHNHEPDLNSIKQKLLRNNGEVIHPISTDEIDRADNNYLLENETFPEALAPTPTPRSPDPVVEAKKPPSRRSPAPRKSPSKTKPQPAPAVAPPRRVTSENTVSESNKARGAMQRGGHPVLTKRQPVRSSVTSGGRSPKARGSELAPSSAAAPAGGSAGSAGAGSPCAVCGRRFAADRLDKHQEICRKAHAKKRKPFDALKHRLAGTEAEPFLNKLRKPTSTPSTTKVKQLNSNWRQKHEEFIAAIRAAKQVQAHLNAGGKLSDLPPPPPSENPDYVACPHCGRRFNQAAADRHIPKCANFQFNKPKPGGKRR